MLYRVITFSTFQTPAIPEGYIPDIPTLPVEDLVVSLVDINSLVEPTLASLGLTSYFPPGIFMSGLEMLHVGLDVPWWCAISMGRYTKNNVYERVRT